MKPIVQEITAEFSYELHEIDISEDPTLAQEFRIRTVPVVLIIVDGQIRKILQGTTSRRELRETLLGQE